MVSPRFVRRPGAHKIVNLIALGLYCSSSSAGAQAPAESIRLPYQDGYVETEPGVRLHYQSFGDGRDTVLVLHGGPGFGSNYLIPDLLPLARARTLIFYDQRTGGHSTLIADTARNNSRTSISDLEAIRRHFGIGRVKLIGHSWGSLLAGLYASEYPERVERMVLIGSSPPAVAVRDSLAPTPSRVDSAHRAWRTAHRERWRGQPADSVKACWDFWAINVRLYFAAAEDARSMWGDVCNMSQATLLTQSRGYPHVSLSAASFDLRPRLAAISAPVLVLHGELDLIDPLSAREWARALPNARLLIVPHAGHFPHVDAPRQFFQTVDRFLREGLGETELSPYDRLLDEISSHAHALGEALSVQDWNAVAETYDLRASIFGPGAPPVFGRTAITSYWRAAYSRGMRQATLVTMEVEAEGSTAIETGKYEIRGESGGLLDAGKYLVVWRRDRGRWRIHRDSYNSSLESQSVLERPDYLGHPFGTWRP